MPVSLGRTLALTQYRTPHRHTATLVIEPTSQKKPTNRNPLFQATGNKKGKG